MKPFLKSLKSSKVVTAAILLGLCAAPQLTLAAAANESVASSHDDRLKVVPTLGYTYFNIQGGNQDYKSKGGTSVAVLAQMPLGDGLEVESGLDYMETGAKISYSDFWFFDQTYTINQIAIPIRAKYIFNPQAQGTHYYGKAGLTPTFVVSAKSDGPAGSSDFKSSLNTFGALTQAGIGADWGLDSVTGRISLDLTYSYGLTKVFKDYDGRSTGYQLQAGYAIAL
jgi:hypothetical protein